MEKIPNTITLLNAVCGMLALLLGDAVLGVWLIIFAMVLDIFDGYLARKLGVSGNLGKELDSLADLVSFGVAPAYLFFNIYGNNEALLIAIFYSISALYRLAKFNVNEYSPSFNGLPSPSAAGIMVGLVMLHGQQNSELFASHIVYVIACLTAISMNIRMSFFSLKQGGIIKNWKLWTIVIATVFALCSNWPYAIITCFGSYLSVSFAGGLVRNFRH